MESNLNRLDDPTSFLVLRESKTTTYQFHKASNTENKRFQMLRSVIEKNSQKMKATYHGMSKGIDASGL